MTYELHPKVEQDLDEAADPRILIVRHRRRRESYGGGRR